MRLIIDLKTRTLAAEPPVYLVRPGAKYHLYQAAKNNGAIAADVPELKLDDGKPVPLVAKIAPMFERARVMRSWANQSKSSRGTRPPMSLDHYRTFLEDQGPKAARTRLRNAANTVLWKIPERSLLYIPASSLSGSAILAEAGSRTDTRVYVKGTGDRRLFEYPGRPILNPKLVPMRDLPPEVTEPGQTILVHNKFSGVAEERLLRAYYGDYQKGNDTSVVEFISGAADFDSKALAQISALAMSVEVFLSTGVYKHPASYVFGDPRVRGPALHAKINSPDGKAQVETDNVVPHVVKAFLLVAVVAGALTIAAAPALFQGNASIVNSVHQDGINIVTATQDALINYAQAAGVTDLQEILDSLSASVSATEGQVNGSVSEN